VKLGIAMKDTGIIIAQARFFKKGPHFHNIYQVSKNFNKIHSLGLAQMLQQ
jgi:hypothetical protein